MDENYLQLIMNVRHGIWKIVCIVSFKKKESDES